MNLKFLLDEGFKTPANRRAFYSRMKTDLNTNSRSDKLLRSYINKGSVSDADLVHVYTNIAKHVSIKLADKLAALPTNASDSARAAVIKKHYKEQPLITQFP